MDNDQLSAYLMEGIEVMKRIKEMNLAENQMIDDFLQKLVDDIEKSQQKKQEEQEGEGEEGGDKEAKEKKEAEEKAKSAEKLRKMIEESIQQPGAGVNGQPAVAKPMSIGEAKALKAKMEAFQKAEQEAMKESEDEGKEEIQVGSPEGGTGNEDSSIVIPEDKVWCPVCEEFHGIEDDEHVF